MKLKTIYVRFYKSFNFDYLRKFKKNAKADPWEYINTMWYPYVRVAVDKAVTTVVGANESGKSHLLSAIQKGISGQNIERMDFCRYSLFNTVQKDELRWPDFGFEWTDLTPNESETVVKCCSTDAPAHLDRFHVFRTSKERLTVYLPSSDGYTVHEVSPPNVAVLEKILPRVFSLDPTVALPESVPIRWLSHGENTGSIPLRTERFELYEKLSDHAALFSSAETVTKSGPGIFNLFSKLFTRPASQRTHETKELQLAHDLIYKIAKIDPEIVKELYRALREGKEGYVASIVRNINEALAANLNFPHWWAQDRQFRLLVAAREFDLVFTIRDRTEMEYSFDERSSGLKYFLSYYIQYLAYAPTGNRPEILTMDEPDAFLSSQAQQDLLKIFAAFAEPQINRPATQVVYVTHSPFLIDKNHGDRLRVLEKGVGEEGTRIVLDVSRNHYEPLRSAFGSFVGETAFIGNCNLMVEGIADQVLLAGATSHLRAHGGSNLETIDLNRITIVPAGSADHIPYLVYLARGRDMERPAVITLLDSDKPGNEAKKRLLRNEVNRKQLLKPDYILQIGDLETNVSFSREAGEWSLEDLIPIPLIAYASRKYLEKVCGLDKPKTKGLTDEALKKHLKAELAIFKSVNAAIQDVVGEDYHIEKIGFVREVTETLHGRSDIIAELGKEAIDTFLSNMKILLTKLATMQRLAERELTSERVTQQLERARNGFLSDHPITAKREDAVVLFESIEGSLDNSPEADLVRIELQSLRRDFGLGDDVTKPIENFPSFSDRLREMKYASQNATQESNGVD